MTKTVAIVQPLYIPWKGYFDILNSVNEFILFDDAQYTKRFWINRNRIKTPQGVIWLTIPVKVKGRFHQAIKETEVSDPEWSRRHWETIKRSYCNAHFFKSHRDLFESLYLDCDETFISQINLRFIRAVCAILGIDTTLSSSTDYTLVPGKTERLVDLCQQAGADTYLTGPSARAYLQEERFREAGIQVKYMDYSGYPEYRQLYPPFVHDVSIIDLIFNTGSNAPKTMKSFPV
jgi:hypothetical protein